MIDPSLAREAVDTVTGARMAYSDPSAPLANLQRIAALWSAYMGVEMTASDVAKMMVLHKLSRSRAGAVRDHYVDAIGYLLMAEAADG